jgi:hypothetical protein
VIYLCGKKALLPLRLVEISIAFEIDLIELALDLLGNI